MIEGKISEADLLAAHRLHSRTAWRYTLVFCTVGAVIVLSGLLFAIMSGLGGLAIGAIGAGLAGGLLAGPVVAVVLRYLVVPRHVRRAYHQDADLQRPLFYSWDDQVVRGRNAVGHWERPWSDYVKFKEDEDLVLLYRSSVMFELFKKSWFESDADLRSFLESTHSKVGR